MTCQTDAAKAAIGVECDEMDDVRLASLCVVLQQNYPEYAAALTPDAAVVYDLTIAANVIRPVAKVRTSAALPPPTMLHTIVVDNPPTATAQVFAELIYALKVQGLARYRSFWGAWFPLPTGERLCVVTV